VALARPEIPALANGDPDLAKASPQDLRTYISLLAATSVAISRYIVWLRVLSGAELAVIDGKTILEDIYTSEKKVAGTDVGNPM